MIRTLRRLHSVQLGRWPQGAAVASGVVAVASRELVASRQHVAAEVGYDEEGTHGDGAVDSACGLSLRIARRGARRADSTTGTKSR